MMLVNQLTNTIMTYISMSQKELDRYDVVSRAIRKEITVSKVGELLRLCQRQVYRLKAKVKKKGAEGLIHGNRGRPSNHQAPDKERQKIIGLVRSRYPDFGPTLASEKLREVHKIDRDPKTIRQIMIDQGLWIPRTHKTIVYRSLRPRKDCFGEMEQFDGSYEKWFEDRGPGCCLLAAIDDATGIITQAKFVSDEGVFPVFGFWQDYLLNQGKPRTIYLDRLRTYTNNQPLLAEEEILTQFQRAMKELGIKTILAYSPQAKGRIERLFGTLQDRLIKELRLRKISDKKTANAFLKQEFLPNFNRRYAKEARNKTNLHRKLSPGEKRQLPAMFSRQTERVVSNDFTLRFKNLWYQLEKEQPATIRPRERVLLEERLDNSFWLRVRGKYLNYRVLPARPERQNNPSWIIAASQMKTRIPYRPPADHPWRKLVFSPATASREKTVVSQ